MVWFMSHRNAIFCTSNCSGVYSFSLLANHISKSSNSYTHFTNNTKILAATIDHTNLHTKEKYYTHKAVSILYS